MAKATLSTLKSHEMQLIYLPAVDSTVGFKDCVRVLADLDVLSLSRQPLGDIRAANQRFNRMQSITATIFSGLISICMQELHY